MDTAGFFLRRNRLESDLVLGARSRVAATATAAIAGDTDGHDNERQKNHVKVKLQQVAAAAAGGVDAEPGGVPQQQLLLSEFVIRRNNRGLVDTMIHQARSGGKPAAAERGSRN